MLFYFLVVTSPSVTDVRKLSCTFDTSLCGWKATSQAPGQPTFVRTKPNPSYGPSVDFNLKTKNGKSLD